MHIGNEVVYVKDPSLYGLMKITDINWANLGMIVCSDGTDIDCGPFHPQELDLAHKFYIKPGVSQAGLPGAAS